MSESIVNKKAFEAMMSHLDKAIADAVKVSPYAPPDERAVFAKDVRWIGEVMGRLAARITLAAIEIEEIE